MTERVRARSTESERERERTEGKNREKRMSDYVAILLFRYWNRIIWLLIICLRESIATATADMLLAGRHFEGHVVYSSYLAVCPSHAFTL